MSKAKKAFIEYLKVTFGEDYDPANIDHLIKEALFLSGYEVGFDHGVEVCR